MRANTGARPPGGDRRVESATTSLPSGGRMSPPSKLSSPPYPEGGTAARGATRTSRREAPRQYPRRPRAKDGLSLPFGPSAAGAEAHGPSVLFPVHRLPVSAAPIGRADGSSASPVARGPSAPL